jgi:hypothetical protein
MMAQATMMAEVGLLWGLEMPQRCVVRSLLSKDPLTKVTTAATLAQVAKTVDETAEGATHRPTTSGTMSFKKGKKTATLFLEGRSGGWRASPACG